jgi:hypothetical protein
LTRTAPAGILEQMVNTHPLTWSAALHELRGERSRATAVREEPLRATAGLGPGLTFSAWHGRSGRRYVVGVHAFGEAGLADIVEAVVIAVRRDRDGAACIIDAANAGAAAGEGLRPSWLAAARARGATEVHVHRLACGDSGRRAVIDDLCEAA